MIITVAGGSGSGKSYLSTKMAKYLSEHHGLKTHALSMDGYYKNSHIEAFDNYDHPDAFNIPLLSQDLRLLKNTGNMPLRKYDYTSKQTTLSGTIECLDVLILEGLYSFYFQTIRTLSELTIFIDTDERKRISRRIKRDQKERAISPETNAKMLKDFVLKMHEKYIIQQKEKADIITPDSELIHIINTLDIHTRLRFGH